MKKDLILIGGGGHCKACIDVIEAEGKFKIAGIIDVKEKVSQKVLGYPIIGCDEDLDKLVGEYRYFFITLGQIKSANQRIEKFEFLEKYKVEFPVIVSPLAYVSKSAYLGEGTIVMHKAFVNSEAKVGRNCIINTNAIVEHNVDINDHCHISTGSIVNGGSKIGEGVFLGSNSVVVNNIEITKGTIIGAGSVVVSSIYKEGIYVGNPVKRIERDG
ncbi:MAG: acetyltransferase [Candidatus Omnitrophica bacterium]|nr:acetyltransferase [Candidatus Omnitrophota bacterium]